MLRYGEASDLQFIGHVFQEGLGRAPSADDEREYGKALVSGTSRADVLGTVAGSAEARIGNIATIGDPLAAPVFHGCVALLGRTPEYAGLVAWPSARIQGLSAGNLARGIAASAEFLAAYVGQADSTFVQSVYQGALHRNAGSDEERTWLDALSHGVSGATVGGTTGFPDKSVSAAFPTTHEGVIKLVSLHRTGCGLSLPCWTRDGLAGYAWRTPHRGTPWQKARGPSNWTQARLR